MEPLAFTGPLRGPRHDGGSIDGIDVLDRRFPIAYTLPPSCFWAMAGLRPDRPAMAGLAARARADEAVQSETFVVAYADTAPIPAVREPVPYLALEEATLAQEFTELDQAELRYALHHDEGAYLP